MSGQDGCYIRTLFHILYIKSMVRICDTISNFNRKCGKKDLLPFLMFLFILSSVSKHHPVPSSFYSAHIVYRSCRVRFVH